MSGSNKGGSGGGWGAVIGGLILLALLIYGISAIGHVLGLTPTGSEVFDGEDGFVKKNYEGVAVGYVLTVAVVAFVLGAGYLIVRARSTAEETDIATLYRGLGTVAVLLVLFVLIVPAGRRDQPLRQSVSQLAAKREAKQDRQAKIREAKRQRAREQARLEHQREQAREQARERRLEARARERRSEARQQAAAPQPVASSDCDPNYSGACLDPNSPDYDCQGGEGDGPDYTGPVTVVGSDHYDLDTGDGDPRACEPY